MAEQGGTLATSDRSSPLWADYELTAAYDEMFPGGDAVRPHYAALRDSLRFTTGDAFRQRKAMTDLSMRQDGVGFTVYRAEEGIERVWPMDPMP
ncbi:MAG: circularly permuted type 2 ATP-grasp protein, partial [Planctomycetia bacterium]|nr:circularly permuted type 2 ATP-grasp protein [Planctomycetia bacterium]